MPAKTFKLPKINPATSGKVLFAAVFLLLVGTFIIWRAAEFLSPSTTQSGNGVTVTWKISDHSTVNSTLVPLPNSVSDTTTPSYDELSAATALVNSAGNIQLPRFQGTVSYK